MIARVLKHVELLLARVLGLELDDNANRGVGRVGSDLGRHIEDTLTFVEDQVSRLESSGLRRVTDH